MDRVRGRAVTTVEVLDRVGHVRLVVGRVEVDTIPAGGEEDLRAHSVGAVVVEEVRTLRPVRVVVVRAAIVWKECEYWHGGERSVGTYPGTQSSQPGQQSWMRCRYACSCHRQPSVMIGISAFLSAHTAGDWTYAQALGESLDGFVLRTRTHKVVDVESSLCNKKILAFAMEGGH